jgi:beta-lactamase class D
MAVSSVFVGKTMVIWKAPPKRSLIVSMLLTAVTTATTACEPLDITALRLEPTIAHLAFVAVDLRNDRCWETNEADAVSRHPPWSTFKIPHLLIALETRAVLSATALVAWDAAKRPASSYWPAGWRQSQSLVTAFERSAAWYFQDLVPKIGLANYEHWLGRFAYGSQQVPTDRDDFWLGGPLAVSPREQARFLACVATTGCGASRSTIRVLESVALSSALGNGRIYGKTGSGPLLPGQFDGPFEGWYVGYVRASDSTPVAAFALYVRARRYADLQSLREEASVRVLKRLSLF